MQFKWLEGSQVTDPVYSAKEGFFLAFAQEVFAVGVLVHKVVLDAARWGFLLLLSVLLDQF